MRRAIIAMATVFLMVTGGGILFAQDRDAAEKKGAAAPETEEQKKEEKKDEKKIEETIKEIYKRLDIGVKVYMDWFAQWGQKDGAFDRVAKGENGMTTRSTALSDISGKNYNAFRINRAYLDIRYKFLDWLGARLTTDVDAAVTPAADANAAFHIYLKYAYLEGKKDFGPVKIAGTAGMIETPVVGLTDKISDYRWISRNYIDQSKNILNGQSLDNSADLGVKASIGLFKYVTLSASFTNGGGCKKDESNSYKAITYLASITPVRDLYINGFGRNEITDKYDYTGKKAKRAYYGYGIAYSIPMIKVGFNHVFPIIRTVGAASKFDSDWALYYSATDKREIYVYPVQNRYYMLFDAWFNFNLGALVEKAPLLVTGRFVYGLQRGTYQKMITDPECGKQRTSMLYAAGLGWQFSRNIRILVGGELQKYFVKKDRLLRYAEGSKGTDYYNATALGAGDIYVGSREPHDSKRVYVKAEVSF